MLRTLNRWLEDNRWLGDAVIASVLVVLAAIGYVASGQRVELAVSALLALPLFARRTFPRTVTVVVALLCCWQLTAVPGPVVGDVVVVMVVHAAAAYVSDRRWGTTAWAAAVCGAGLAATLWFPGNGSGLAVVGFAAGLGAVSAAYLLGARQRDQAEHVQEQLAALRERNRLLAIERDQRAEMAAARERTTIARELHDIVAHSLTVIVVQADGAAAAVRAAPQRADIAPTALDTIATTSRDALTEMRRLVGVLRSGAAPRPSPDNSGPPPADNARAGVTCDAPVGRDYFPSETSPAAFAPSPGVADLPALVEQTAATGIPVTLTVTGQVRPLPPSWDLTVYRVVQEGLTNVLRHGGPAASVTVELVFSISQVRVTVVDDGRGAAAAVPASDHGGHGLIGMWERVGVHNGSLRAGPRRGGGFEVVVELPLPPGPAPAPSDAAPQRVVTAAIDGAR